MKDGRTLGVLPTTFGVHMNRGRIVKCAMHFVLFGVTAGATMPAFAVDSAVVFLDAARERLAPSCADCRDLSATEIDIELDSLADSLKFDELVEPGTFLLLAKGHWEISFKLPYRESLGHDGLARATLLGIVGNLSLPKSLRDAALELRGKSLLENSKLKEALRDVSNEVGAWHLANARKARDAGDTKTAAASAKLAWYYDYDDRRTRDGGEIVAILRAAGSPDAATIEQAHAVLDPPNSDAANAEQKK